MSTKNFRNLQLADWALHLKRAGIFFTIMLVMAFAASAQTDDEWDDDEEEDDVEEKTLVDDRPSKKEDVTIKLDEVLFTWKEELTVHRDDTLSISVRDLAPASRVEFTAAKGGINLGRKIFYANNKGELDLEIRVGNKKMKGSITLSYTPSGGAKKERELHLIVD